LWSVCVLPKLTRVHCANTSNVIFSHVPSLSHFPLPRPTKVCISRVVGRSLVQVGWFVRATAMGVLARVHTGTRTQELFNSPGMCPLPGLVLDDDVCCLSGTVFRITPLLALHPLPLSLCPPQPYIPSSTTRLHHATSSSRRPTEQALSLPSPLRQRSSTRPVFSRPTT